jgi:predicted phosphoribosyltransferase
MQPFKNRTEAGRMLAEQLAGYAGRAEVVVLALPRGGVPVAHEVARALDAPLDIFIVQKLGVPGQEELAMGAIGSGGVRILNDGLIDQLGIDADTIDQVTHSEEAELNRREQQYRQDHPQIDIAGRTVILIDDGIATGATMQAAVHALRQRDPQQIVLAVPAAPPEVIATFEDDAAVDSVLTLITPESFGGVARWYDEFPQTSDAEVTDLLRQHRD